MALRKGHAFQIGYLNNVNFHIESCRNNTIRSQQLETKQKAFSCRFYHLPSGCSTSVVFIPLNDLATLIGSSQLNSSPDGLKALRSPRVQATQCAVYLCVCVCVLV